MSEGTSSHATAESLSQGALRDNKVEALSGKVEGLETQLTRVLQLLESSQAPSTPVAAPVPDVTPVVAAEPPIRQPPTLEAYKVGTLQFSLPNPPEQSVAQVLNCRRAYGRTGKLNTFEKSSSLAPYPAKRFIPEPEGLFRRIKDADQRDSYEAEVLWNIGHDYEVQVAAFHQIAVAIADR